MNLVLGKLGKAQEWLNRAGEEHDSYLCWLRIIPHDFYLHPDKSGFKALLKKNSDQNDDWKDYLPLQDC